MTVSTFVQPNFTAQLGNTYKGNIDAAIAALAQMAINFLPHEAIPQNMTVVVEAGKVWAGTLIERAQQFTATIAAPTTNPRIDRVVIDALTGDVGVVAGSEAASPIAPAIPVGKLPIARINLSVGMTQITNALITDERLVMNSIVGSLSVGDPVGGDKGPGTVNSSDGVFVDGVRVQALVTQTNTLISVSSGSSAEFDVPIPSGMSHVFMVTGGFTTISETAMDVEFGFRSAASGSGSNVYWKNLNPGSVTLSTNAYPTGSPAGGNIRCKIVNHAGTAIVNKPMYVTMIGGYANTLT